MPLVLPRRSLNIDFVRDGQASGDNYATELSKLDGLLTFTRASTATRFNAAGVLETVASGQPRFDFNPVTLACKGLLIEEARTNLVLRSQSLATSPWALTGGPTITSGADTSCGVPLDLINDSIGGASNYPVQDIVSGVAGTMAVSFFIRKGTAPAPQVQVYDLTASEFRGRATISWSGNVPELTLSLGASSALVQQINANVYRCSFLVSGVVSANTTRIYMMPTAAAAGNTYYGGVCLEAGSFATSYIPTTTAAVTRAADLCSTTSLKPWFNKAETFTLAATYTKANEGGDRVIVGVYHTGPSYLFIDSATYLFNRYPNAAEHNSLLVTAAGQNRVAMTCDAAGVYKFSRNGALGTGRTDATKITGATELFIGHYSGPSYFLNGHIERLTYLPYAVSETLLKALTT